MGRREQPEDQQGVETAELRDCALNLCQTQRAFIESRGFKVTGSLDAFVLGRDWRRGACTLAPFSTEAVQLLLRYFHIDGIQIGHHHLWLKKLPVEKRKDERVIGIDEMKMDSHPVHRALDVLEKCKQLNVTSIGRLSWLDLNRPELHDVVDFLVKNEARLRMFDHISIETSRDPDPGPVRAHSTFDNLGIHLSKRGYNFDPNILDQDLRRITEEEGIPASPEPDDPDWAADKNPESQKKSLEVESPEEEPSQERIDEAGRKREEMRALGVVVSFTKGLISLADEVSLFENLRPIAILLKQLEVAEIVFDNSTAPTITPGKVEISSKVENRGRALHLPFSFTQVPQLKQFLWRLFGPLKSLDKLVLHTPLVIDQRTEPICAQLAAYAYEIKRQSKEIIISTTARTHADGMRLYVNPHDVDVAESLRQNIMLDEAQRAALPQYKMIAAARDYIRLFCNIEISDEVMTQWMMYNRPEEIINVLGALCQTPIRTPASLHYFFEAVGPSIQHNPYMNAPRQPPERARFYVNKATTYWGAQTSFSLFAGVARFVPQCRFSDQIREPLPSFLTLSQILEKHHTLLEEKCRELIVNPLPEGGSKTFATATFDHAVDHLTVCLPAQINDEDIYDFEKIVVDLLNSEPPRAAEVAAPVEETHHQVAEAVREVRAYSQEELVASAQTITDLFLPELGQCTVRFALEKEGKMYYEVRIRDEKSSDGKSSGHAIRFSKHSPFNFKIFKYYSGEKARQWWPVSKYSTLGNVKPEEYDESEEFSRSLLVATATAAMERFVVPNIRSAHLQLVKAAENHVPDTVLFDVVCRKGKIRDFTNYAIQVATKMPFSARVGYFSETPTGIEITQLYPDVSAPGDDSEIF